MLADNLPDFLATYSQQLMRRGFRVLTAANPVQAEQILQSRYVHLAILDKRLEDDNEEMDSSGIALAARVTSSTPIVILTRFPTSDHAAEAMRKNAQMRRPAVDFIDKNKTKDYSQLLAAIEQVFDRHVELNWELAIYREPQHSLTQMVSLLGQDLADIPFEEKYCEITDLFRRLFRDQKQITLDEIVLYGSGYFLVKVFAFDGANLDQFIVSCSRRAQAEREETLYKAAVPRFAAYPGLRLHNEPVQLTHFGAIAYHVHGGRLQETVSLSEILIRKQTENLLSTLDLLFSRQLTGWHERGARIEKETSLADFYTGRMPSDWVEEMDRRVRSLSAQILDAGIGRCDYQGRSLRFFPRAGESTISTIYPNPSALWKSQPFRPQGAMIWGRVHGNVRADTALIGSDNVAWLIDFTSAGEAPLMHDYVTLEADLKRQTAADIDLSRLQQLETRLLADDSWPDRIDLEGLPEASADLLRLVGRIRRWAATQVQCSEDAYLAALFYVTCADLEKFQPDIHYPSHRLKPFASALLSAAMIGGRLQIGEQSAVSSLPDAARTSFWFDRRNREIWVEGQCKKLTPQEYTILDFMSERTGQLCTRKELHKLLNIPYDDYRGELDTLTSAMSRLRQKIEPEPKHPRFLETVRGQGFKLHAPPLNQ